MKKPMLTTLIILAVLVLTFGGYFGYKYWQNRPPSISYPYEIKVGKLLDEFGEDKTKFVNAGIITIGPEHFLTYEADKKYEELIKNAVDEINSKTSLSIDSPPPPGTNFTGSFGRIIEKQENDWALAVEEDLEKNYNLIKIQ